MIDAINYLFLLLFRFVLKASPLLLSSLLYAAPENINNLPKPGVQLTPQEQAWIKQHPRVLVGGSPDWAPFNFVGLNGEYSGIANDYLNLIATKTGLTFEVSIDQWSDNLDKIRNKQIDLLGTVYYTEKRSQYLTYSKPYFEALDYFFVRNDLNVKTLDDLDGKRVAIPQSYAHLDLLKKHFPKIKIVIVDTFGDAIDAVLEKRADILYDTYGALIYTLEKEGINTIIPFKSTRKIGKNPLHIVTRKDLPELAAIIQKGLNAVSTKEKRDIYKRWLGQRTENEQLHIKLSKTEKKWLAEHPVFRFTSAPGQLPYGTFNKHDKYIGIVAEHLKLIEKKLSITLQITSSISRTEVAGKVKQGEIDILSESSDSSLKSHLDFTHSYLSSPIIIVMKSNQNYVEGIAQIKQQKIALIKEYGYTSEIIKKHPGIEFHRIDTIQEGLTAVSTGKIDALIATLAQASYHISELGINNIRIVGKTAFTARLAFGIRKELAPLIPLFNRALATISPREKQRILNIWGKPEYVTRIDTALLSKIAGIFLLISLIFIYWNRKLAKEITLRKEVEAQTQALIDNIPLQIIVTSSDGYILTANPKALDDYNLNKEELELFAMSDFYHDSNERDSVIKELRKKGQVDQKIIQFNRFDGTLRSMMLSIMPIIYHKQRAYLTIAVDMTERIEMEASIKKAKEAAETANRAKSEFLANMSHEIRTPLNAIIGFTELLNEQIEDPRHKSFTKTIQSAGSNLLTLINDILDLSKIEAGKLRIEKMPCNLHDLLTELGNIFILKIREKNIDLILDIEHSIPQSLQMDALRLKQVLLNLIGNAVKFTEQGSIRVKAYTVNENKLCSKLDLIIEIEDTGIGVSKDQQQLIFHDFEQSASQDNKKYGGTGLGLSISKRLVEIMGGKISLKSLLGQGSVFSIHLHDIDVASSSPQIAGQTSNVSSTLSFHPGNILIVDDIKDNRDLILAIFATTKLHVTEATNGLEAVKMVRQHVFDLILMDIHMPIMDGYQAAAEIRAFSDVPIVALTASVMKDEFDRLKRENFAAYLRKPVSKAELLSELCNFLPFEEITAAAPFSKQAISLSADEHIHLPQALKLLEQLDKQYQLISTNNNISEIKNFADAILKTNGQYPIIAIHNYATQLISDINSFDIAAIKRSLNDYPELINQLEQLNISGTESLANI